MPTPFPHPPRRRQRPLRLRLLATLRPARSIAVVGVGSDLRGDDVVGLLVVRALRTALASARHPAFRLFEGGTAPENLTGEILRFRPSHILLADAADLGLKPGAVSLIEPEDAGGVSFSTHVLPLKILTDYLAQSFPCRIVIIGIQPGRIDFGAAPSAWIKPTVLRLSQAILQAAQQSAAWPIPTPASKPKAKKGPPSR